jgi:tRNA (cytidine/uridine-2'-O-)-methyltransferase
MIQLVLVNPEIPQNTGSVARLCAATNTHLHLIKPLGFSLEDRYLKRAGLDYWPYVRLSVWENWEAYQEAAGGQRLVLTTSGHRGIMGQAYHAFPFSPQDSIVLGPESRGLPEAWLESQAHLVRIPIWGQVRSLNLANAASILLYEALRRTGGLPE